MLELYLGGARSGKSRLAEQRARSSGKRLVYLATATAGDAEMAQRITHHQQQRRHDGWQTIEEPIALAATLARFNTPDYCVLVDCLTLWLTNLLLAQDSGEFDRQRGALLAMLPSFKGQLIMVSNEVGQGVVPMDALSRRFVDESGFLHQALAAQCDRVVFSIAGLPQVLKGDA